MSSLNLYIKIFEYLEINVFLTMYQKKSCEEYLYSLDRASKFTLGTITLCQNIWKIKEYLVNTYKHNKSPEEMFKQSRLGCIQN